MKTKFNNIPEYLKEPYEIEGYKGFKTADATSVLVPEISAAVSAALRENWKDIRPSWKVMKEQYPELDKPTLSQAVNSSAMNYLGGWFLCKGQEKDKETREKKNFTAEIKDWTEGLSKVTVSE